ncbi:hypothetical protein KY363_01020 [Candidatus Woesearchaeota archaeon]|nr:hypothetical protein [Candidatus Woesearchaeota archaeon]
MTHTIKRILERTELILLLAIALPLIIPADVSGLKILIEISLGIVMLLSLRPFMGSFKAVKKDVPTLAIPVLISYVLLSGTYLLLAYLFFGTEHDFFTGYLLIALIPPAVSIIPFCYIAHCDKETADIPVIASFLLSLITVPLTIYLVFGESVDMTALFRVLAVIVIIPMYLAHKTRKSESRIFEYSKALVNICLGIVIFISIALNRGVFFDIGNRDVIMVYIINLLAIFGLGVLTYTVTNWLSKKDAVPYSFYATQKNVGTSITLGILLFHPDTAVPAIIALAMQFIYFVFFKWAFIGKQEKVKG